MDTTRRVATTIEMIPGQRAAVIESRDNAGNWLGAGRIEVHFPYLGHPGAPSKAQQDRDALYELGYQRAEVNAVSHGGTLDRFGWTR